MDEQIRRETDKLFKIYFETLWTSYLKSTSKHYELYIYITSLLLKTGRHEKQNPLKSMICET